MQQPLINAEQQQQTSDWWSRSHDPWKQGPITADDRMRGEHSPNPPNDIQLTKSKLVRQLCEPEQAQTSEIGFGLLN